MKILIAIPTFESIYPDTYQSVWNLDRGGHEIQFEFIRGYDVATARNKIVQRALGLETDYVLMVDNDVILPRSVLLDMLSDPVDVCLGYYAHRNADNRYTGRVSVCKLGWYNYPLESEHTAEEMFRLRSEGRHKIEIHGGGMGCALIRTAVFERLKYPWYDWVNYADDNRGMLSEDLYFCEQCKAVKIPVYTDARAGCGHIFRYVQWPEGGVG